MFPVYRGMRPPARRGLGDDSTPPNPLQGFQDWLNSLFAGTGGATPQGTPIPAGGSGLNDVPGQLYDALGEAARQAEALATNPPKVPQMPNLGQPQGLFATPTPVPGAQAPLPTGGGQWRPTPTARPRFPVVQRRAPSRPPTRRLR